MAFSFLGIVAFGDLAFGDSAFGDSAFGDMIFGGSFGEVFAGGDETFIGDV